MAEDSSQEQAEAEARAHKTIEDLGRNLVSTSRTKELREAADKSLNRHRQGEELSRGIRRL